MQDVETLMVDLRALVRQALLDIETEQPFQVRQRWGHERPEGLAVTYAEKENRSTHCPVVDFLSYQIDVWAPERAQAAELSLLVNRALLELGLRRLSKSESVEQDGTRRCTMVFGRGVDKRWGRFVDLADGGGV